MDGPPYADHMCTGNMGHFLQCFLFSLFAYFFTIVLNLIMVKGLII